VKKQLLGMKEKLLLLHGALGSKKQFDEIAETLKSRYDIFRFDFEGHGGQALPAQFTMSGFSKNVSTFLSQYAEHRINIFGYSMGGYAALKTALRVPVNIGRIITLGTKFDWSEESARREVKMLDPDKIEMKVPHFASQLKATHAPQDWKAVVNKTAEMMTGLSEGSKLRDEDLRRIENEVYIGIGKLDAMVSRAESEYAASLLPKGQLVVLEGVKHPIEAVDAEIIASYIDSCMDLS
jgi:pimeloyl-ACP methyl ester carboxylesterase